MKRFFRRWIDRFSASVQGVPVEEIDPMSLPLFDRCRYVYDNLNTVAFADYKQMHGHGKQVTMVHPNIEACLLDIAAHIKNLEANGYVVQARVEYVPATKLLNRFFITNEGNYLPSVQDAVTALVLVMLDLCKVVDEAKHIEYETKSYNLRMLNSLFHVMTEFGVTLTEISHEIQSSR